MRDEDLDSARAAEAQRIHDKQRAELHFQVLPCAVIAARLAREGWTPQPAYKETARWLTRDWALSIGHPPGVAASFLRQDMDFSQVELVLLGIHWGASCAGQPRASFPNSHAMPEI